jgi:hypothetical protein
VNNRELRKTVAEITRGSKALLRKVRKKAGRPKLPSGQAKGSTIQVRFTADDTKVLEAGGKASNKTVSQLIRSMVDHWLPAYCPFCKENVNATIGMSRADLIEALERGRDVLLVHAFPLAPDHKFPAKKEQKDIIRKRITNRRI